jgi:hypothetical protein
MVGMVGLMLVGMRSYASASWASGSKVEKQGHASRLVAVSPSVISRPVGLYVQGWDAFNDHWQSSWDSWTAGPMLRTFWVKVNNIDGKDFVTEQALNKRYTQWNGLTPIPSDKKLLIGFSPKNNQTDCYFGIPQTYYTDTRYNPLQLKYNGQDVTRTCNGQSISTAINFLDDNVKTDLAIQIKAFIRQYANNPKVAGFSFAGGANDESTPWVHDVYGTIGDPKERPYEKYTYSVNYSGEEWAE